MGRGRANVRIGRFERLTFQRRPYAKGASMNPYQSTWLPKDAPENGDIRPPKLVTSNEFAVVTFTLLVILAACYAHSVIAEHKRLRTSATMCTYTEGPLEEKRAQRNKLIYLESLLKVVRRGESDHQQTK